MNKYYGWLLTVISFSFIGNSFALQKQDNKFFDEKTKQVIALNSMLCGVVHGGLYGLGYCCVIASGLTDILVGDSIREALSDTRDLHRYVMKDLNRANRRILPLSLGFVGYQVAQHKNKQS